MPRGLTFVLSSAKAEPFRQKCQNIQRESLFPLLLSATSLLLSQKQTGQKGTLKLGGASLGPKVMTVLYYVNRGYRAFRLRGKRRHFFRLEQWEQTWNMLFWELACSRPRTKHRAVNGSTSHNSSFTPGKGETIWNDGKKCLYLISFPMVKN